MRIRTYLTLLLTGSCYIVGCTDWPWPGLQDDYSFVAVEDDRVFFNRQTYATPCVACIRDYNPSLWMYHRDSGISSEAVPAETGRDVGAVSGDYYLAEDYDADSQATHLIAGRISTGEQEVITELGQWYGGFFLNGDLGFALDAAGLLVVDMNELALSRTTAVPAEVDELVAVAGAFALMSEEQIWPVDAANAAKGFLLNTNTEEVFEVPQPPGRKPVVFLSAHLTAKRIIARRVEPLEGQEEPVTEASYSTQEYLARYQILGFDIASRAWSVIHDGEPWNTNGPRSPWETIIDADATHVLVWRTDYIPPVSNVELLDIASGVRTVVLEIPPVFPRFNPYATILHNGGVYWLDTSTAVLHEYDITTGREQTYSLVGE